MGKPQEAVDDGILPMTPPGGPGAPGTPPGGPADKVPGTVATAPGGIAKLFVAWCGDSRAVLLRGRQGMRLSEDHRPARTDEQERIKRAGGRVLKDPHGIDRVGPKAENRYAKELQKGKKEQGAMKWFLSC